MPGSTDKEHQYGAPIPVDQYISAASRTRRGASHTQPTTNGENLQAILNEDVSFFAALRRRGIITDNEYKIAQARSARPDEPIESIYTRTEGRNVAHGNASRHWEALSHGINHYRQERLSQAEFLKLPEMTLEHYIELQTATNIVYRQMRHPRYQWIRQYVPRAAFQNDTQSLNGMADRIRQLDGDTTLSFQDKFSRLVLAKLQDVRDFEAKREYWRPARTEKQIVEDIADIFQITPELIVYMEKNFLSPLDEGVLDNSNGQNDEETPEPNISLQQLLLTLRMNTLAKHAAKRLRNEAFNIDDTVGRFGLMIRTIDDMNDLSISEKLYFFAHFYERFFGNPPAQVVPTIEELFIALRSQRRIDVSDVSFQTGGIIPQEDSDRLDRATRRAATVEEMMRENRIKNVEDWYTEERHWVFEALTFEEYNMDSWEDFIERFRDDFDISEEEKSNDSITSRMREVGHQLESRQLLPHDRLNREEVIKKERIKRIIFYCNRPEQKGRRIYMKPLGRYIRLQDRHRVGELLALAQAQTKGTEDEIPQDQIYGPKDENNDIVQEIRRIVDELVETQGIERKDVRVNSSQLLVQLQQIWPHLTISQLESILFRHKKRIGITSRKYKHNSN